MEFNPHIRHRRSIRLQGYDYSRAGAYFVTICSQGQLCLFGDVLDDEMQLSDAGQVIRACWADIPAHYSHVELDAFVIMPNHVHGIIILTDVGAGFKPALQDDGNLQRAGFKPAPTVGKRHGLPEIVRGFKTFSSRRINKIHKSPGTRVWQRNYYEHIIRDEAELDRVRKYIIENQIKWAFDPENPAAHKIEVEESWQV